MAYMALNDDWLYQMSQNNDWNAEQTTFAHIVNDEIRRDRGQAFSKEFPQALGRFPDTPDTRLKKAKLREVVWMLVLDANKAGCDVHSDLRRLASSYCIVTGYEPDRL